MRCGRSLALCVFVALSLLNGIVFSRGIKLRRQDGPGSASTAAISLEPARASSTGGIPSVTDVRPTATNSSVGKEVPTSTATNSPAPTVAGSYGGSDGMSVFSALFSSIFRGLR